MFFKVCLLVSFLVAFSSASGCCRGFKIFQFRRPNVLPIYEGTSPCDDVFDITDQYNDNTPIPLFPADPIPKYEESFDRYFPTYIEPKPHKCVCGSTSSSSSKPLPSQRMMPSLSRYHKRSLGSEHMYAPISLRSGLPCGQCTYGPYDDCGHYGHCGMAQTFYRHPAHRILPLTLPTSCVC